MHRVLKGSAASEEPASHHLKVLSDLAEPLRIDWNGLRCFSSSSHEIDIANAWAAADCQIRALSGHILKTLPAYCQTFQYFQSNEPTFCSCPSASPNVLPALVKDLLEEIGSIFTIGAA